MNERLFFQELGKQIYRMDAMYAQYAKRLKLKNVRLLWVLYALDDGTNHSQKEISANWNMPKSSVNTVISELYEKGYVRFIPVEGQKRELWVRLTPSGEEYAKKMLSDLYEIEKRAFVQFAPETMSTLSSLEDINQTLIDAGINRSRTKA